MANAQFLIKPERHTGTVVVFQHRRKVLVLRYTLDLQVMIDWQQEAHGLVHSLDEFVVGILDLRDLAQNLPVLDCRTLVVAVVFAALHKITSADVWERHVRAAGAIVVRVSMLRVFRLVVCVALVSWLLLPRLATFHWAFRRILDGSDLVESVQYRRLVRGVDYHGRADYNSQL